MEQRKAGAFDPSREAASVNLNQYNILRVVKAVKIGKCIADFQFIQKCHAFSLALKLREPTNGLVFYSPKERNRLFFVTRGWSIASAWFSSASSGCRHGYIGVCWRSLFFEKGFSQVRKLQIHQHRALMSGSQMPGHSLSSPSFFVCQNLKDARRTDGLYRCRKPARHKSRFSRRIHHILSLPDNVTCLLRLASYFVYEWRWENNRSVVLGLTSKCRILARLWLARSPLSEKWSN